MPLKELLKQSTASVLALYLVSALLRIFQIIAGPDNYFGQEVEAGYHVRGFIMDLEFVLLAGLLAFLLSLPFLKLKRKIALIPMHLISITALTANFVLLTYFLETNQPLADVFFTLSSEELAIAADLNTYLTFNIVLSFIGLVGTYFLLFFLLRNSGNSTLTRCIIVALWCVSIVISPWSILNTKDTTNNLVANNKVLIFLDAAQRHYFSSDDQSVPFSKRELGAMDPYFFQGEQPTEPEYPFMHQLPEESTLNTLLNHDPETPPNIVVIIVESLSDYMYGEKADASGHMMPFLDSLSGKSIYYPNMLSTCERTHNVLPAALTSIPNPPNYMQLQTDDFPKHWSLMSLLDDNYFSRFYCGTPLEYCNMNGYMSYHNTDYLVNNWGKPFSNVIDGKKNPWGYPDGDLFSKSEVDLKKQHPKQPRLDVFLTMSTHPPFMIPNQQHYIAVAKKRFRHNKAFAAMQAVALKKPESLATYAYTDDMLRAYFNTERKKPEFKNTIFLIFGDHGNHDFLFSPIDRFKTSLMVYSPLIKQPKTIASVSTHLDITPSLINYLRLNYPDLHLPNEVPFYGSELTTSTAFSCNRTLPLVTVNEINRNLVMGKYAYIDEHFYVLGNGLQLIKTSNPKKEKFVKHQLELFCRLSKSLYDLDKIIPENIFKAYVHSLRYQMRYEINQYPEAKDRSKEYIDLGDFLKIDNTWKGIRVECTMKARLKNPSDLEKLPKFTVTLDNLKGSKKNNVFWKQTRGRLVKKFIPNDWNTVVFSKEILFKGFKPISKENMLRYFLLNPAKKDQPIKDLNVKVYSGV